MTAHRKRFRQSRLAPLLLLGLALVALAAWAQERRVIDWPRPKDVGVEMLDVRQFEQELSRPSFAVTIDFRFTDQWRASGIAFEHQIVDDAGKYYKPVHYDHGNGLAIADVDGDRLEDVYFTSQLGGNALYKNLGNGTFRDITAEAAVAVADRISVTASFADIDNDGDADLYVTTVRGGNLLFRNDGSGHFTDVTAEAGVGYVGHSSAAVFVDFDRDGRLDLLLVNVGRYTGEDQGQGGYYVGYQDAFLGHLEPERTEQSILYRNTDGLHFADVSAAVGLEDGSWSGDATFTDFNGDLYPDLYVLNMQGDDHYYENQQGRRFVDRSAEVFPKTPWGTMGIKFFDYDNDGDFDLLLTDMHSDMSREVTPGYEKLKSLMTWSDEVLQGGANNIFGNAFYRNLGGGRFEEVSDQLGLENYWPWGVSVGDLNADGFEDVFVTSSMNFPWRYGVNS
ncbi:MAG: FG-GAP repeat domain-containing protein, partial [Thermoanaerobaculia bacterium]